MKVSRLDSPEGGDEPNRDSNDKLDPEELRAKIMPNRPNLRKDQMDLKTPQQKPKELISGEGGEELRNLLNQETDPNAKDS